jgi:hypothetical protein
MLGCAAATGVVAGLVAGALLAAVSGAVGAVGAAAELPEVAVATGLCALGVADGGGGVACDAVAAPEPQPLAPEVTSVHATNHAYDLDIFSLQTRAAVW